MNDNVLSVAVIGAGYWGKNLVRTFATAKRCTLKDVCDINEGLPAAHQRNFPAVRTTAEARVVLDDPEVQAVAIATPAPTGCGSCRCSKPDSNRSKPTAPRLIRRSSDG